MSVHGNSDPWSLVKSLRRHDSRSKAASAAGGAAVGERCLHAMHGGAGDLLHKADKIRGFIKQQRGRTQAAAGKNTWMTLAQDLEVERRTTECQLLQLLEDASRSCPDLASLLHCHAQELCADADDASELRLALFSQVKDLASVINGMDRPAPLVRSTAAHDQGASGVAYDTQQAAEGCTDDSHLFMERLGPASSGAGGQQLFEALRSEAAALQQLLQHEVQRLGVEEAQIFRECKDAIAELSSKRITSALSLVSSRFTSDDGSMGGVVRPSPCLVVAESPEELVGDSMQVPVGDAASGLLPSGSRSLLQQQSDGDSSCQHLVTDDSSSTVGVATVERGASGASTRSISGTGCRSSCSRRTIEVSNCAGSKAVEDPEVESLIRRYVLAPPSAKEGVRRVHRAMMEQHQQRLEEWRQAAMQAGCLDTDKQQPGHKATGGWSPEEHSLFIASRTRAHGQASAKGGGPNAMMTLLALLLPGKSSEQLRQHENWYIGHCLLQRRLQDIMSSFDRQLRSCMADSQHLLSESAKLEEAAAEAAADRVAWQASGEQLHGRVEGWRLVRDEERRVEALHAQQAARKAAEERLRREQVECTRRGLEKAALDAAHEKKAAEVAAARMEAAAAAEAAALAAATRIAAEKPAVAARQVVAVERLINRQVARRKLEEAALTRRRRLDELVFHAQAEADAERILQQTESSGARTEAAVNSNSNCFRPVHGFTTQEVLKDQRFRVLEALGSAGLRGTLAAREAVASLPPARRERLDAMSSAQRAQHVKQAGM